MEEILSDITEDEMNCLKKWVKISTSYNYLELGCCFCKTIFEIAKTYPSIFCIGIDVFNIIPLPQPNTHTTRTANYLEMWEETKDFANVTLLPSTVSNYIRHSVRRQKSYGFVFHDANHTFIDVLHDLMGIYLITIKGSIVAVHNTSKDMWVDKKYVEYDGGPRKAVEEAIKLNLYKKEEEIERITILRRL
jgi:hypothetical protein